jgi:membrane protein
MEQVFNDRTIDTLFVILTSLSQPSSDRLFTTIVSIGLLVFGATGVFNSLKDALDRIWRVKSTRRGGLWGMIKSRGLALLSVLVLGLVVLLLVVADRSLAAVRPALNLAFPDIPAFQPQWFVREFISLVVIRFGLVWLVIAYMFRVLPDAHIRWRDLWVGAALTALLFLLGQIGIGYYLSHTSLASAYGAAGSLVLILVWIYYSAQVFLLGAELTYAYASHFGRDIEPAVLKVPFGGAVKDET